MTGAPTKPHRLRKVVAPDVVDPPSGTFSHCIVAGQFIYVSGQHAGSNTGPVGGDDMKAQAREAFRRVLALVAAAGAGASEIVKLNVYLTDMRRRGDFSAVRREFFADPFPCSTLVGVTELAEPALLVEIEAVALLPANTDVER